MKLEHGMIQRPEQRLALLPRMLQSIEVLQLGGLELEAMVQKSLSENETLKLREDEEEPERERARRSKPSREASDRHQEMLANAPARHRTLHEYLRDQTALLDLSERMRAVVGYVVENVDENGYLSASTEEMRQALGGAATLGEVREAEGIVRSLDPKGVGGRGPVECLLLQLEEGDPEHGLLRRLILEFLEDLSKNRLPKVAKALGLSLEDLKEVLGRFRSLNPRPGSGFAGEKAPPIRPDVLVEKREDGIEIRVEDSFLPRLEVEESYWKMSRDRSTPAEVREYLRGKIDAGRWLIDSIEQRRLTLLRVAQVVFAKQKDFLERGPRAVRPLMMKEVAEEVGVHVSTVSRAVANKYAQTPLGIFPLRQFFSAAAEGESETSRASVREMVRDLVGSEDPGAPLSDEEIVLRLRGKGIEVARRTVAKYRTELKIPSSWRRRAF